MRIEERHVLVGRHGIEIPRRKVLRPLVDDPVLPTKVDVCVLKPDAGPVCDVDGIATRTIHEEAGPHRLRATRQDDLEVLTVRAHLLDGPAKEELGPERLCIRLQSLRERAVVHARVRLRVNRAGASDVRLQPPDLRAVEELDLAPRHPVLRGPGHVRLERLHLGLPQGDLKGADLGEGEVFLRCILLPEAVRHLRRPREHASLLRVEIERAVDDPRVPAARVFCDPRLLLEDDEPAVVAGGEPVRHGGAEDPAADDRDVHALHGGGCHPGGSD